MVMPDPDEDDDQGVCVFVCVWSLDSGEENGDRFSSDEGQWMKLLP